MNVDPLVVLSGLGATLTGLLGWWTANRSAKSAADKLAADSVLENQRAIAEAKKEQNSQTLQASDQLFKQLREFISDLQRANNELVGTLAKERNDFRAAMDLERTRCDKEIEAINKELDAANDRWRKTDRLSLEQEGKIHDLELAVIRERRSPTNEPVATGRRATDLAPTAL